MRQDPDVNAHREFANCIIRPCETLDDFDACTHLQVQTWGAEDTDVIPRSGFLIAHSTGGQVLGAWRTKANGEQILVGAALAYISVVRGAVSLYSHLLAVDSSCRNMGIGRALKLAQRDEALERGIKRIEWTFDPLEIKNSFLNIARLGAVARRYKPDYYGRSSSPLHGGLPTDRLIAEWWLDSGRVRRTLLGEPLPFAGVESIYVPREVSSWKADAATRHLASEIQARNREKFQTAFAQGLTVIGFERDSTGNGIFKLGHWQADSAST